MKYIETEKQAIRAARRRFLAMAATYCLGVFNDNFFKQAVLLIAVSTGLSHFQGPATILFALPFIVFSAYAGWCADTFSKRKVIIASKALEIVAMATGAYGLLTGNWSCILAMVFFMGAQSTFFSPALNGSIPELYPAEYVPKANAILKMITTLAILAGIALAGFSLDLQLFNTTTLPPGNLLVALGVVGVAVTGFLVSFGVYSKQTASKRQPFPWAGPLQSLKILRETCRDKQLALALVADCFFYFLASMAILTINSFGLEILGFSRSVTSFMSMSLMIGVSVGSILVARKMEMSSWSSYLSRSAFAMAAGLLVGAASPLAPENTQGWLLAASLFFTGIGGGFFLIPVTSFLQVKPDHSEKGRVLATANFCGFISILFSGIVYSFLSSVFTITFCLLFLAGLSLLGSLIFAIICEKEQGKGKPYLGFFLRSLLSLRYRMEVSGLDDLNLDKDKAIIFLPNHPALIDPVIVMSQLYKHFQPRPLSDENQVNKPVIRQIMSLVKPITLPSPDQNGRRSGAHVRESLNRVIACLKNDEQIILYPSGKLYRSNKESLSANSAVETIIKRVPDVQIVLLRTTGLWGSSFSWANGKAPSLFKHLAKQIWALLTSAVFFLPKRRVTIEAVRDHVVPTLSERKAINSHLEQFYNSNALPNTTVPYFWWHGRKPTVVAEPEQAVVKNTVDEVSATVKQQVLDKITDISGISVSGEEQLANDLGMDSLSIMECIGWLEAEYGVTVQDSATLLTVNDCVLAAAGKLSSVHPESARLTANDVPASWFAEHGGEISFTEGSTITSCFLQQLEKNPRRVVFCDQISEAKTFRDVATAIFALAPFFQKEHEANIGIMLPASVSGSITFLTALFTGKTPVMYNWTSGVGNMHHGIKLTGTGRIITARKLYNRIEEQQGVDLSTLPVKWLFLDEIATQITLWQKVSAFLRSRLMWRTLRKAEIPERAVILFTSGSEAKPKAVPLTHTNILCNMKDFSTIKQFSSGDSLLGMLPPFHSLGLVGTTVLPACTGLKTVYHTDPTDSAYLAGLIEKYKVTITIGTPTFINGILQSGRSDQFSSLQYVFTGAEKCPAHVYQRLQDTSPHTILCEGYGITECSPLVSINAPEAPERETIGKVLPSISYRIVDIEKNRAVAAGEQGILLVRGKSIFNGYLGLESGKGFREFEGELWYDTGDFVKENENGNLEFCGRLKRFIKLAGEMISLPAIETVLLDKIAGSGNEGPVMAVEATEENGQPEITLYSTIKLEREKVNGILKAAGLSPLHNIRKIVEIEEIPLLGTGKTDYTALRTPVMA